MEVAKCFLRVNPGCEVPKFNITPAELLVLVAGHSANAGGDPITKLELTGVVDRSNSVELARLRSLYGNLKHREDGRDSTTVGSLFPGSNASLPQRFADLGPKFKNLPVSTNYKPGNYVPSDGAVPVDPELDSPATAPIEIKSTPLSTAEGDKLTEGLVPASQTVNVDLKKATDVEPNKIVSGELPKLDIPVETGAPPISMPEAEAPPRRNRR